ncbi:MAG TPA: non-homologous end-joining DNA ligase [Methylomirabilota bacterium]|nr:non-homologous end-joining DNA ligase [Methylomirabilota bacterium]
MSARPPAGVRPMLATLVEAPFHERGWVYEEKYDGIRIVATKNGARVRLTTRNLIDRTAAFPHIASAIARLPAATLVLDGEIVIFDAAGVSRFQLFGADTPRKPVYVVFDLLFARGHDLRRRPLTERRAALQKEVAPAGPLRLARRLAADGFAAFEAARERGLEGIVAKDGTSVYETGKRSMAWRKVKVRAEEEFVVGGYTAPAGARTHFGAILVGAFDGDRLRYAGKVGTGFTAATLGDLARRFRALVRPTPPFVDPPRERAVTWLDPQLVAQVGFMERTGDGRLRHPVFLGLRGDKSADEVRWTAQTA